MKSTISAYIITESGIPSFTISFVIKPPDPYAIMAGAEFTGKIAVHCATRHTAITIPVIGTLGLFNATKKPRIAGIIAAIQDVMLVKQKRIINIRRQIDSANYVTERLPTPESINSTWAIHLAPPVLVNISAIEIPAPNKRIVVQSTL